MRKTKQLKAAVLSTVVGVLSPLAMMVPVSAADVAWTGATDDFYNDGTNWSGGSTPSVSDVAVFSVDSVVQNISVASGGGNVSVGGFTFEGEVNDTSSKSYTIGGGSFALAGDVMAMMTGAGGDHAIDSSIVLQDNVTFMTSGVDTLTIGGDERILDLNGNNLTLDASGGTITLQGEIDGEGDITIENGKVNFLAEAVADGTYNPTVSISGGTYETSAMTRGNVVLSGGVLMGNSQFLGDITMTSGSIQPGFSPGCLGVDSLTLSGGSYVVEIDGNEICDEYDSTAVLGDIDLGEGDTELDIDRLAAFEPEVDDEFRIITYEDDSVIDGYFDGWEEGETNTVAGFTYQINYDNDSAVVLSVTATPDSPDTGVGSLMSSPVVTMGAAFAALGSIGALKFADTRKRK